MAVFLIYLELQENLMATVSKLTTKVHSWSPAGTRLGLICWQIARGNMNRGGFEATSEGSFHISKKGSVSSWTLKTTQYLKKNINREHEEKLVKWCFTCRFSWACSGRNSCARGTVTFWEIRSCKSPERRTSLAIGVDLWAALCRARGRLVSPVDQEVSKEVDRLLLPTSYSALPAAARDSPVVTLHS